MEPKIETQIITNFSGNITRLSNGALESGNADYSTTYGVDSYSDPGDLSFMEQCRDIKGGVVTDLIMAIKVFPTTTGNLTALAIGNTGRFYQIQVNNTATDNPDYDIATLLTTILFYVISSSSNFESGDNITSSSGGVGIITSLNTQYSTITISITSGTFLIGDTLTDLNQILMTSTSVTNFNINDNVTSSSGGVGTVRQVLIGPKQLLIRVISGTFLVSDTITSTTSGGTGTITVRANLTTPITSTTTPTFHYGGTLELFGIYMFIGHDKGLLRINPSDGSGVFQVNGSWQADVPRPLKKFISNLYVGNQYNIAEVNSSGVVLSSNKLSPSVQSPQVVVDLDVTSDGVYLVITSHSTSSDIVDSVSPNVFDGYSGDSGNYYWNGTDTGITRFTSYPSFNASAYATFSSSEYLFGNDILGTSLSTPSQKVLTLPFMNPPVPNAISSDGNMVVFMAPEYIGGKLQAGFHAFGQFDIEMQPSHFRNLLKASTLTNGDVVRVNAMSVITDIIYGPQHAGYTNNVITNGKIYFSTLEYDGSTTYYGFWAFNLYPTGSGNTDSGAYGTQQQLYSKKISCKEIRVYMNPAVVGQSFRVDLVGIDGNVITDTSGLNTFTVGTSLVAGETIAWYNPIHSPTPALGILITNLGTVTPHIHKVEVDRAQQGK